MPDTGGNMAIRLAPERLERRLKSAPARPALLLVPDELQPDLPVDALKDWLAGHGLRLAATRSVPAEYEARLALPAAVAEEMKAFAASATLCFLTESWLPPIASFLELLGQLRRAIGAQGQIIVLLIGKAKNGASAAVSLTPTVLALVPPDDPVMVMVWRQKLAALADPALRLLPFDQEDP